MRVLLAGAGGAVGQQLIQLLVRQGYTVGALTRSESKREVLLSSGAAPFIADALDPLGVQTVVEAFRPDAIINQLTAIPQSLNLAHYDREFALTNRLRTEGTDNLLAAAKKGAVLGGFPEGGVVLRYGWFYGPRTSLDRNGPIAEAVRRRMLPIVAGGTGLWSFLHIYDAASAALAALHCKAGIYNVADDEPALVRDWISKLAEFLAARSPFHVPAWMARFLIGEHGVALMRANRGMSNSKAKRELSWAPRYPNWRDGFKSEFTNSKQ